MLQWLSVNICFNYNGHLNNKMTAKAVDFCENGANTYGLQNCKKITTSAFELHLNTHQHDLGNIYCIIILLVNYVGSAANARTTNKELSTIFYFTAILGTQRL